MIFTVASHQLNKQVTAKVVIGQDRGCNLEGAVCPNHSLLQQTSLPLSPKLPRSLKSSTPRLAKLGFSSDFSISGFVFCPDKTLGKPMSLTCSGSPGPVMPGLLFVGGFYPESRKEVDCAAESTLNPCRLHKIQK